MKNWVTSSWSKSRSASTGFMMTGTWSISRWKRLMGITLSSPATAGLLVRARLSYEMDEVSSLGPFHSLNLPGTERVCISPFFKELSMGITVLISGLLVDFHLAALTFRMPPQDIASVKNPGSLVQNCLSSLHVPCWISLKKCKSSSFLFPKQFLWKAGMAAHCRLPCCLIEEQRPMILLFLSQTSCFLEKWVT